MVFHGAGRCRGSALLRVAALVSGCKPSERSSVTMSYNRIDVRAEINACEYIRAFDEPRLDFELRRVGLDPDGLPLRLEALLMAKLHIPPSTERPVGDAPSAGEDIALGTGIAAAAGTQPVSQASAGGAVGAGPDPLGR